MSSNQMEALREKEAAERLMVLKDYKGAREKLFEAQQLFPALDHVAAMLTVCDVLSAATLKTPSSEIDCYWVLQVGPSSSFSCIDERYQKILTLLEPVKNKLTGTELALESVQAAYNVLSDLNRRSEFDLRRNNAWANYESLSLQMPSLNSMSCQDTGDSSQIVAQPHGAVSDIISADKLEGKTTRFNKENASGDIDSDVAEISPPKYLQICPNKYQAESSKAMAQKGNHQDFYNFDSNRNMQEIQPGQIWAIRSQQNRDHAHRYAQIVAHANSAIGVLYLRPIPLSNEERKWCGAGLPVACGSFALNMEMGEELCSPEMLCYKTSWCKGVTYNQVEIYPLKGEVWALYENWDLEDWFYNPQVIKSCKYKLVEFLTDFSKDMGADCVDLEKVDGFRSIYQRQNQEGLSVTTHISPRILYRLAQNVPAYRFTGGEMDRVVRGMLELDLSAMPCNMMQQVDNKMLMEDDNAGSSNSTYPVETPSASNPHQDSKFSGPNILLQGIDVGQVWAVYCGRDSLPRQYTRIDNVVSESRVCVTFLELLPMMDYENSWKSKRLPIACGMFRVGESKANLEMSQLSHPVYCQTNMASIYKVYPLKGEIWASYQNWKSEWKPSDYGNSQYLINEVLSDFTAGETMTVARLGRVRGCYTFFVKKQIHGFDLTRTVSKEEMASFSHQIPSFRVPGIGRHGIPECSWHLEPNALPSKNKNTSPK